jgi:phosphotransferase system enzyme I (PtsI)
MYFTYGMGENKNSITLKGIGTGSGIAIAKAIIIHRGELTVPVLTIEQHEIEGEIQRFRGSLNIAKEQLLRIRSAIAKTMGEDAAGVIEAQVHIVGDPCLIDETEKLIGVKEVNAEHAFEVVMNSAIDALGSNENPVFKERVQDFKDVKSRILSILLGLKHQIIKMPEDDSVLVIDQLAPSETAHLFGSKYVGLATETGGFTSHMAIMSRTMDLPGVLGIDDITNAVNDGDMLIVDSLKGVIIINPDERQLTEYHRLGEIFEKHREIILRTSDQESRTPDGRNVSIAANMELVEEVPLAKHFGAAGIGLFRTELLFMDRDRFPEEDEQFSVYKKIAEQMKPKSAIIRTFDIGGDKFAKTIGSMHYEPNPFLGWRAIRIGLEFPDIFKTHLKALLRASYYGNIKIMFPMISVPEEMQQALSIVEEAKSELREHNIPFNEKIEIGIMIEVPSAAILARDLAEMSDFFSIGTNDLIQYTLAADRGNPRVAHIYQSFQPAVLKLVKFAIDAAHFKGIWVGMCGELAGEVLAVPLLLGMDLDEFSVVPSRVPLVKTIINRFPYSKARILAENVLSFTTQDEVLDYLTKEVSSYLPAEIMELETVKH